MSTSLEALSGELFHSAGDSAAAELGGEAAAPHYTLYGPKFIAGELVYDHITDPEPVSPIEPTTRAS
jgi:hypothetical protein